MSREIAPEVLSVLGKLNSLLADRGVEAYAVGGLVRDILMGRPVVDIDIAVAADAVATAVATCRDTAEATGGKFVLLDAGHDMARLVLTDRTARAREFSGHDRWYIDFSGIEEGIHQDLARRDFTIDAMAVELKSLVERSNAFEIIDPFGGQRDLADRLIRIVAENAFEADPARILRAFRLAAELGFKIHDETAALIRRDRARLAAVAGERVREELLRILATGRAGRFVLLLDKFRVLTVLMPELEHCRGVVQPLEHHWDVLEHSLQTVRTADFILRQDQWEFAAAEVLQEVPWSEELTRHFAEVISSGSTRASLFKLAALLHDVSKPETKVQVEERIRFFGHTEQGADIAAGILERLRFSHKEISLVENMVRNHMRPTQMSNEGQPTPRAIYRFFRDTGSTGIEVLYLSLADHLAARGPGLVAEQWHWHTGQVKSILAGYYEKPRVVAPVKLLDGHDLISLFGLKAGPQIRELLEAVREAQASGEVESREQALSYVKNRLLYREQK